MTPQRPPSWLTATMLIAMVAGTWTILGVVWAASNDRARVMKSQQHNCQMLADHEIRIRQTEKILPAIRSDVSWIRETMEKSHP